MMVLEVTFHKANGWVAINNYPQNVQMQTNKK